MSNLSSINTYLNLYREALFDTLSNNKYEYDENNINDCLEYDLLHAITRTSHVVKATTVAWGAGLCIYAARLMAAIGARKVISENLPGKGSDVHKVLAVSSLEYLDLWRRGDSVDEKTLRIIINNSIEELDDLIKKNDENIKEVIDKSVKMLKNLIGVLPNALEKLGIGYQDYGDLRFLTELELVDYRLHIWGVPDLIIEHPRARKAIVVEWKSDEGSPRETDKFQAYIYAMLEARRLGYGETFDDIINAIAPDDVNATKVFPIIIRPTYPYSDHPILPMSGRNANPADIQELRDRLRRIAITSTYLTLLLMDIDALLYGKDSKRGNDVMKTRDRCAVERKDRGSRNYIFRMTPAILYKHSGYPAKQDGYQCRICPFSDENSKLRECTFYFGLYEKDKLDKLIWNFRFKVYRERDRDLIMYKALYLASELRNLALSDFKNKLGHEFCGLKLDLDNLRIDQYKCKNIKRSLCGIFEIKFDNLDVNMKARLGVYEVVTDTSAQEDLFRHADIILLKRRLTNCESSTEDDIPNIALPRIRQPVLVTLIEDHVKYPTLGASLFGRVERTILMGDEDEDLGYRCGEDEVCVVVTPISPYLRLPFKLFKRYVNLYNLNTALVAEVGADLTHMDLATLHALHMALKTAGTQELELSEDEKAVVLETVERALSEAFSAYME